MTRANFAFRKLMGGDELKVCAHFREFPDGEFHCGSPHPEVRRREIRHIPRAWGFVRRLEIIPK